MALIDYHDINFFLAFFDRIISPPSSAFAVQKRGRRQVLRKIQILLANFFKYKSHEMAELRPDLLFIDFSPYSPDNSADIWSHKAGTRTETSDPAADK